MNFEWSEEQQLLADSLHRVLQDHYAFEQRQAIVASETGTSRPAWAQLAALGVTGLGIPEGFGGMSSGTSRGNVDRLPVLQLFGRFLVQEPYLASVVLGATAVREAGSDAQKQALLPGVANGELQLAWAHDEDEAGGAPRWVATRATRDGQAWRLDGAKNPVLHGHGAHRIVVTARVAGQPGEDDALALFVVDPRAEGVSLRRYRLVDGTPSGELRLAGAMAQPLGDPGDGQRAFAAMARTQAAGAAAACADMVGAMETAFALTRAYLLMRRQFGKPIAEYQALRHRLAEMKVAFEMSRSMAIAAAVAADEYGDPKREADTGNESDLDLPRASLVIGRHARAVCEAAIQLHGGIGMTESYAVGHCLRRVHVLGQLFGDAQVERLAALTD